MQKLRLDTPDGFSLAVEYSPVESAKACVVMAHGMTVNMYNEGMYFKLEDRLNKLGVATIRFDFRAHGQSSGISHQDFCISGELTDLATIMDFAKQVGAPKLALVGASFGGGISALYAGDHAADLTALVLVNPVLNYQEDFLEPVTPWARGIFPAAREELKSKTSVPVGSRNYPIGPIFFDQMANYFPLKQLARFDKPLLVIHGTNDDKIDYASNQKRVAALPNQDKQFVTLDGAGHGFHEQLYEDQAAQYVGDFLVKQLL